MHDYAMAEFVQIHTEEALREVRGAGLLARARRDALAQALAARASTGSRPTAVGPRARRAGVRA
jgi:hypothetical protein